jgi:hypothetical protein
MGSRQLDSGYILFLDGVIVPVAGTTTEIMKVSVQIRGEGNRYLLFSSLLTPAAGMRRGYNCIRMLGFCAI